MAIMNIAAITDITRWDLTMHRCTHHVTKASAPLLCIIINYHLNAWVGDIFQHCSLCSHLRIFHSTGTAASVTWILTLFTSLRIPLFALLILLHLFSFFPSFHPLSLAVVECCSSQCFIYHCVPREDMFHPPGRVAVPNRSQSVCWLNNGAKEGREAPREAPPPCRISNAATMLFNGTRYQSNTS